MKFQFERNPNEPLLDVELIDYEPYIPDTWEDRGQDEYFEFCVTDKNGEEVDHEAFKPRLIELAKELRDES